jgi:Uma2 family endonuclease
MSTSISEHDAPSVELDERLYEVVNGQRVELEPMGAFESVLASVLLVYLESFARSSKLGVAVGETLFVLDGARKLKRRPDVAFVSYSRWPETTVERAEAWNVVPDLAIEIISPTNLAEAVDEKIVEYFQAGVQLAWVLYPTTGRVHVYESANKARVVEQSGELDGGQVLPGFRLPIQSLFDAMSKPQ